jgi:hypothetical protein
MQRTANGVFLAAEEPVDNLGATALLVLTLSNMPPSEESEAIRREMVVYLKRESLAATKATTSAASTRPSARRLRGAYLACMALEAGPGGSVDRAAMEEVRSALAGAVAPDAETDLWRVRAKVPARALTTTQGQDSILPARMEEPCPADEVGGFAARGSPPSTVLTSLKTLVGAERAGERASARQFCQRMVFGPREAFFAEVPADWVGGVRAAPRSARVTLEACAAAIEALLLTPSP